MRLGLFSDVHANFEAMMAVADGYTDKHCERYYCLGDVVGYGASPQECADFVREVAEVTVVGNHDAAVAGLMDYQFYYEAARRALDLHGSWISSENKSWLAKLPYLQAFPEWDMQLCHGSPLRVEEFSYIFVVEQARECLQIWDTLPQLTVIGHSHLCKVFELTRDKAIELPADSVTLKPESKYIISAGSVGQPRDFDNRAAYTVFDVESRHFQFHRRPYDIEAAARRIFESDLDDGFGHRLFLGA